MHLNVNLCWGSWLIEIPIILQALTVTNRAQMVLKMLKSLK